MNVALIERLRTGRAALVLFDYFESVLRTPSPEQAPQLSNPAARAAAV